MQRLQKREVYDVTAPNKSTKLIGGKSSNVLNWEDCRFSWAYPLYNTMVRNFWLAEEINMLTDIKQWKNDLTNDEKEAFKKIIGLLAFLDSVQTDFVGRVSDYITDSSIVAMLSVIGYQEVIHNQSYSYVLSSLVPKQEQDEIFEYWRHDPILLKRNQFIADGYAEFCENPTPKTFMRALVLDVMLEGLFFYMGFAFFYNMARNQKMVSSQTVLGYINRDEQHHVRLFTNLYKELLKDYPELNTEENKKWAVETIKRSAQLEMDWGSHIIGNKFEGLDKYSLHQYIKFIANKRSVELGLDKPYPDVKSNPFRWIKAFENSNNSKSDFFEQTSRQYSKVGSQNSFDDL